MTTQLNDNDTITVVLESETPVAPGATARLRHTLQQVFQPRAYTTDPSCFAVEQLAMGNQPLLPLDPVSAGAVPAVSRITGQPGIDLYAVVRNTGREPRPVRVEVSGIRAAKLATITDRIVALESEIETLQLELRREKLRRELALCELDLDARRR